MICLCCPQAIVIVYVFGRRLFQQFGLQMAVVDPQPKKYVKEIYVGKFTLPITISSANQKFVLSTISSTTQRPRRNLPCSWRARYVVQKKIDVIYVL